MSRLNILIIEIVVIICVVLKKCIRNKTLVVNHYFCFSLGFFYYAVLPFLIYEIDPGFHDFAYKSLHLKYKAIHNINMYKYFLGSMSMYLAFILGSNTKEKKSEISESNAKYTSFLFTANLYFVPLLILGVILTAWNYSFLFRGYFGIKNTNKGALSAFLILVLSILLFVVFSCDGEMKFYKLMMCKWGILFFITSFLLLTMGGRLYVITGFFSLVVAYSLYNKSGISIRRFFEILIIVVASSGMIGVIRKGGSISLSKMAFNVIQEPIYTSYSIVTYLVRNDIKKQFSFPRTTLSGFINLIPSKLFPQKVDYIVNVFSMAKGVEAPLGATHFFVSYVVDYGFVGSIIAFFLFGRFIALLKKRDYLSKTIYCMYSASFMFTIFRDNIPISLIKNVFELSICIPLFMYVFNRFFEQRLKGI